MNLLLVGALVTVAFFALALVFGQLGLRGHRGMSREEFIRAFSGTDIPNEIPAAVYDYYKKTVIFREFSIAPDDSYEDVFRKCEEDIEDDARLLMKKLSFKPPSLEAQQQWSEQILASRATSPSTPGFSVDSTKLLQPIQTVRDMVLWLNWVRQQQEVAASRYVEP